MGVESTDWRARVGGRPACTQDTEGPNKKTSHPSTDRTHLAPNSTPPTAGKHGGRLSGGWRLGRSETRAPPEPPARPRSVESSPAPGPTGGPARQRTLYPPQNDGEEKHPIYWLTCIKTNGQRGGRITQRHYLPRKRGDPRRGGERGSPGTVRLWGGRAGPVFPRKSVSQPKTQTGSASSRTYTRRPQCMQIRHMLPHRGALRRVVVFFRNHPRHRERKSYQDICHLGHSGNTDRSPQRT
jgi:hypothetical protein